MTTARQTCVDCGASGYLALDMQDTANGPRYAAVCERCYRKDAAERKAEGKRLGFRPNVRAWGRLKVVQLAEAAS